MYQVDGNTYVKLWRSTLNNGFLMSDNNAFNVFIKLLLCADRKTATFTTGRYALAELCNMKPSTVRDVLKRLEREGLIKVQPDYSKSKILICKWEQYQSQPVTSPSPARHQDDTKQEERKKNITSESEKKLLSILNARTKRSFRVLPTGSKKLLATFSLEEIDTALGRMAEDPWHKQRLGGLSSDYMLRASTIDKFLNSESAKSESFADRIKRMEGAGNAV